MRDLVDEKIFEKVSKMKPFQLWKFARIVTIFGKALYDLEIEHNNENLQKYIEKCNAKK